MRGILWLPMIGVNQIAVRTVGQILIAKDEIDFLAGKHFLSLGPRGAGNYIRGKAIERANEDLANFQLRRKRPKREPDVVLEYLVACRQTSPQVGCVQKRPWLK